MLQLPASEIAVFILASLTYLSATVVSIIQLRGDGQKYHRLLMPLVSLAVTLEAVLLILRAAEIKAVPLTGLFESMMVLTIVFGLIYLFLNVAIQQIWFSSVMVWVISSLVLLAGLVAEPAAEPMRVAATPWAIAHGVLMILGGAAIMLATAAAVLYLLADYRLKHKMIMQVLGRIPNVEKLEKLMLSSLWASFLLLAVGVITGIGLICMLSTHMSWSILLDWVEDPKVICILAAWLLLAAVLLLNRLLLLKARTRAYMTIAVFVLVLAAIVGVAALGATRHQFSLNDTSDLNTYCTTVYDTNC